MPLDHAYVGRSFGPAEAYLVGREKIREFVEAIGDDNSIYLDKVAARNAGHPDVVAPPTFAAVIVQGPQDEVFFDRAFGLDFSRVVHREQRLVHRRPIYAGDMLSATVHVDSIKVLAGNEVVTARTELADAAGESVCTVICTLVARA